MTLLLVVRATEARPSTADQPTVGVLGRTASASAARRVRLPLGPRTVQLQRIDDIVGRCPSAAEVALVDSALRLTFEDDPTRPTLLCSADNGSANLTRLQRTAYVAILALRHIRFDTPLPWTEKSLYDWLIFEIRGITFKEIEYFGSCCDPPRVITVRGSAYAAEEFRWQPGVAGMVQIILHEARHAGSRPGTSGGLG